MKARRRPAGVIHTRRSMIGSGGLATRIFLPSPDQ